MKTRVSSAFVNQQTAKMMNRMKSNVRAYKVEVITMEKDKVVAQSDHYFPEPKIAHSFASKKIDKNTKAKIFENAGGEKYILLAEYSIDPAKLARPSAFVERMNMAQAVAKDVAQGATHFDRWVHATKDAAVAVLVRHKRPSTAPASA